MKKALLVGINSYKDAPLKGCVNDVHLIKKLLVAQNYEVDVLVENMATKINIMENLEALLFGSNKDDSILFHFSGHGSQVPDISGDEKDGLDECLLPIDYSWDNVILDDDLDILFNRYPNAHVEVILDACHSGSGTRSALLPGIGSASFDRFIQPPMELFEHINSPDKCKVKQLRCRDVVTWSGCRDDQTSADANINGQYHGIFTYALCNNMCSTRICSLELTRKFIKQRAYSQVPQLDCKFTQLGTPLFECKSSLIKSIKASLTKC